MSNGVDCPFLPRNCLEVFTDSKCLANPDILPLRSLEWAESVHWGDRSNKPVSLPQEHTEDYSSQISSAHLKPFPLTFIFPSPSPGREDLCS